MSHIQMLIAMFVLSCAARIRGCYRRWRQPLVRGPEWFFSVHVPPDFYAGAGGKILHRYRLRMFNPIAVEAVLAAAIFLSGHIQYLFWLVVAASMAVHVNHLFNVDLAERQARSHAVPEAEQPVSSVMLSLTPRRLRDYSNSKTEKFIILASIGTLVWLVRYYLQSPAEHSLREVFGVPALVLYCQLGLLFAKYGIVAWRTPIPQAQAEEHLRAREETRRLHLRVCDWARISWAAQLMFWPVLLSVSPTVKPMASTLFFATVFAVAIVLTVYQEIGRHRVLKTIVRIRPMKMPDFLHTENSGRLLCYEPGTPMLLIRGARGYSLNLANKLTQLGAGYLAGLITLFALLRMGH